MSEPVFNNISFTALKEQSYALWHLAFGDSREFIDAFFESFLPEDVMHTLTIGDKLVSVLYALPQTLCVDGKFFKAAYIYAVATLPEYRGCGYMRMLMDRVEQLLASQGVSFVYLLPASDSLREYYSSLGYENCSCRSWTNFSCSCSKQGYSLCEFSSFSQLQKLLENKNSVSPSIQPSLPMLKMCFENCRMQGGGVFLLLENEQSIAVVLAVRKEKKIYIVDVITFCTTSSSLVASVFSTCLGVEQVAFAVRRVGAPFCMSRIIGEDLLPYKDWLKNVDVGFTLDK